MTVTADLVRFRTLLSTRLGWAFPDGDLPQLSQVLAERSAALRLSPTAYLGRLGSEDDELSALAEDLAITETYFFRHGEQFHALAEDVLPERIRARAGERVLRMLSVGCSSGEEAYTMAILARQARPVGWTVSILGLDANSAMLGKAAAARYSSWSLRETPDAVRERWFGSQDGVYELNASIRDMVRFRRHNVADDDPALWRPGQYDVIFCRNLLMYLTPATAGALVHRMTRALAPGGYLFLGHTDSLGRQPEGLEELHSHRTFYYRRADRSGPVTSPRPAADVARQPPATDVPPHHPAAVAPRVPALHDRALALTRDERFAEALALVEAGLGDWPLPDDLLLHGVLLAQAGRIEDAEIICRRLLDLDGLYADAHHLLGVCLEGGASVDVAIGHYRLAAHLDAAFAMPRLRLGLLSRRRGDHRAAATELDAALHLLRDEGEERIILFGGGFGRIALTALCRAELDAPGVRR